MNIGAFYQSGHKYAACYKAIEQLRKFYPNIPIALYEEGGDILVPISEKFNLVYKKIEQKGKNSNYSGRPVVDLETNLLWLSRIHEACQTSLKDVDWVLHYEDDVWCRREITRHPKFDLSGANGPLYTPELYAYLKKKFGVNDDSRSHWSHLGSLESYGGCGGVIFKREAFIKAYEALNTVPWEEIHKLDSRVVEWSDASLSFVFQWAGFTCGYWEDWELYNSKNQGNWWDKTGWTTPMEEQHDVAFLHGYKHFYNYKKEDI